jgi:hypothetical protein
MPRIHTLASGRLAGLLSGLGAATADAFYVFLSARGLDLGAARAPVWWCGSTGLLACSLPLSAPLRFYRSIFSQSGQINQTYAQIAQLQDQLDSVIKKRGRVNVLVAGRTGVGKSTLINAVF